MIKCQECIFPECICRGCKNMESRRFGGICPDLDCEFFITSDIKLLELYLDGMPPPRFISCDSKK